MLSSDATEPDEGITPYSAAAPRGTRRLRQRRLLQLPFADDPPVPVSETERYGPFTTAGETVYDRPFQFGSKRTGPDLARVGGRYSDDWHRLHLMDPRALVPQSNMPGYPWLAEREVDPELITAKMKALRTLGDPYTDEQIAGAAAEVDGKTELDAVVAYLQGLGTNRRATR